MRAASDAGCSSTHSIGMVERAEARAVLSNPASTDTRTLWAAVLCITTARLHAASAMAGKSNTLVKVMLLPSNVRANVR